MTKYTKVDTQSLNTGLSINADIIALELDFYLIKNHSCEKLKESVHTLLGNDNEPAVAGVLHGLSLELNRLSFYENSEAQAFVDDAIGVLVDLRDENKEPEQEKRNIKTIQAKRWGASAEQITASFFCVYPVVGVK